MKHFQKSIVSLLLVLTLMTTLFSTNAFASGVSVKRLSGNTRFETCIAIADRMKSMMSNGKFDYVILTNGSNFPDALSGSYLASTLNAPILIVDSGNNAVISQMMTYISNNLSSSGKVIVLGGTSAVSAAVYKQLTDKFTTNRVARLDGDTRLDTNLNVLKAAIGESEANGFEPDTLLVATAENYPDALSASAIGSPILLVQGDHLTANQISYLKGTHFEYIYYLGGTSVIKDSILSDMKAIFSEEDHTHTRIWGQTRYETSQKIAEYFFHTQWTDFFGSSYNRKDWDPEYVFVAYGGDFPDALCGGPLAAALYAPLLLSENNDTYAQKFTSTLTSSYTIYALGGAGTSSNPRLTDAAVNKLM